MTHTPLVLMALSCTLFSLPAVLAAEDLECRPIATSEHAVPEICTTNSYREELAAYINLGTAYQADGARWTDRIELWPELSENQVVFGNGRTTLRMNAYLRVRDLKDLLDSIRPRLNLLRASPEFSKKLKDLVAQHAETKLNLSIPLRLLLDTPFTGAGAGLVAAKNDEKAEPQTLPTAITAQPLDGPAQSGTTATTGTSGTASQSTSAVHKTDLTKESCKAQITALIQTKEDAEEQFKNLEQVLTELSTRTALQPAAAKKQKNRSLAAQAEDIEESDCDKCDQAVAFCKSHGTLRNTVSKKDGCRQVVNNKACYASVPAPFLLPVENCRGTHPRQMSQLLQSRGLELKKKITELNRALEKKDQECASEAVEAG